MKVKQFLNENKIPIAVALFGVAAGFVTYHYIKKSKKQKQQAEITPSTNNSLNKIQTNISRNSSQLQSNSEQPKSSALSYNQKFTQIINQIRSKFDGSKGEITPQIIQMILSAQYELASEELKALTYQSRKQRRQNIHDGLQYARILTKYQYDLQQIQQKHLGVILARFNIDKASWKQATNAWQNQSEKSSQELSQIVSQLQKQLLLSYRIVNTKAKPFQFIQNVLKFKIKNLQTVDPDNFGADLAADAAGLYQIIQAYINDLVYQKFNVEQEDIQYSIQQLNQAYKQKIIIYEDKISQQMQAFLQNLEEKESNFY